jgi:DNA-binding transcriptional ArsR family regulator
MQKNRTENKILESAVEDALVSNPNYLRRLLGFTSEIALLARQFELQSREQRLDLLYLNGNEICLIELKVTGFQNDYITQIDKYRQAIQALQAQGSLPPAPLKAYLLVNRCTEAEIQLCAQQNIELVQYSPEGVLKEYFNRLASAAPFLQTKPNDYGVFSLGLINRSLRALRDGSFKEQEIANKIKLAKSSVHNHLRIAQELGLVREREKKYYLTDLGDQYIEVGNEGALLDTISDGQAALVRRYIADDPFATGTVFGIYSIVEATFLLSRNVYPIKFANLRQMFVTVSGKESSWRSKKSRGTATYTFLNYSIDLGLLGRIGHEVLITPSGIRFILMLQLHKSLRMIDSMP